ncbi:MAG: GIY-YIG nuclease family protein [bacterium]
MRYVYILQSITKPDEFYTGSTGNFKERLKVHNAGCSPHTNCGMGVPSIKSAC